MCNNGMETMACPFKAWFFDGACRAHRVNEAEDKYHGGTLTTMHADNYARRGPHEARGRT